MIGRWLLHYEVLEKLGQGGMGIVYKARDTHLDRAVALKVLPPEIVAHSERKLRFVQEAKAASSLNHPNIITIHDIAMDKGVDFIVMEYVAGKTLSQSIPREGLPTDETLKYALQMAEALARAHGAGIIHRDHKPSNIMVDAHGVVKLLDFGLAKLTEEPSDDGTDKTRSLREPRTNAGVILGTLAYMSPEQAEGKPLDVRTDIFSFGAVLYEMVTGRRAFQGESVASVLAALLRENPTPLRQLTRGAPQDLERIIVRCLQKNRDARYPSMAVVVRDLEECRSALQQTSTGSLSLRRLWHEIRRPKFAIPAIAVMLTLTGGLTWLFQRNLSVRWARNQALPEIARLIDEDRFRDAYAVAEQAAKYIPNDPTLLRLWPAISRQVTILTTPHGSEVYRRAYDDPNAKWHRVGTSPIENLRVPRGIFHWRIESRGRRPSRDCCFAVCLDRLRFRLRSTRRERFPRVWFAYRPETGACHSISQAMNNFHLSCSETTGLTGMR